MSFQEPFEQERRPAVEGQLPSSLAPVPAAGAATEAYPAPSRPAPTVVVATGKLKYTHPRSKVFFTLGIYLIFWHYSIMCGLRDDFGVDIDPGREILLGFIPFYGAIRWWWWLKQIEGVQERLGMQETISCFRAFWLSPLWFGSAVYVNKHVNAMYMVRHGQLVERSRTGQ